MTIVTHANEAGFTGSSFNAASRSNHAAPLPPTGLQADADNHCAILSWDENTTDHNLIMYLLEYKSAGTKWQTIPIYDASATSYTVKDLTNNVRYQFRLKVQNDRLKWSDYSKTAFASPADATLKDLRVDDVTAAGFSPEILVYNVILPEGTTVIPIVTAAVNDEGASVVVTNAESLPGSAAAVVSAKETRDGIVQKTYTVHFTLSSTVSVSFESNGGSTVAPISMTSGQPLGTLLVPNREGYIFLGWYTDNNSFQNAVSVETIVTSDLILYARYSEISGISERDGALSVSAVDREADFAIDVLSTDSTMSTDAVKLALQLEVLDETDFAGLSVSGANGTYTVTAAEGYTPGSSYILTLANDALTFAGEPESVRYFNFSIQKQTILDLQLNPGIIHTPVSEISDLNVNGVQTNALSVPLAYVGIDVSDIGDYGTFTYNGSDTIAVGDILTIYVGTHPDQRDADENYSSDYVAYIEVLAVDGTTVTFKTAEAQDVLFIPDVLPVDRSHDTDGDPYNNAITIAASNMTFTSSEYAEMGLDASTVVEAGDYLVFYDGSLGEQSELIGFGIIVFVERSGDDYIILYEDVSAEELYAAIDLYSSFDASFEQMTKDIDIAAMEAEIEQQAVESGFAQAAADYLVGLAMQTDGFQEQLGEVSLQSSSGFEIKNLQVDAQISKDLLHFADYSGLRCAVTVSFDIVYSDNLTINLSGTFVEEIRITVKANGGAVWKWKWIIPYISDYRMTASVDLYNFTGIDIKVTVTTNPSAPEGSIDIEAQIKEMMNAVNYESEAISAETKAFYELYREMLANDHDYVVIFSQEIFKMETAVDPLHILVCGLTVDFVVSADVNLALGCHFAYENGTRYLFTLQLFSKSVTCSQLSLIDENYTFQFYVMGTLGLRAGILVTVEMGLFSLKTGSIGIQAEAGVYVRMWGFFFYELRYVNRLTTSEASGALYLELGVYLKVSFLAQAFDNKYFYNPTLYEKEWPLWSAGSRYNVYDFAYELTDSTNDIFLKGDNLNYELPAAVFSMSVLDLKEGVISTKEYNSTSFTIVFTNSSFSAEDGKIMVAKPIDTDITEGNMTIYWNAAPLSFTTVPITRTYQVVWDNLSDSYLISFNSMGGGMVSAISGAYGSEVTLPLPSRPGYIFSGWYENAEYTGSEYTSTIMPAANIQLYARWTARTDTPYTVRHYQQTVAGASYELVADDTMVHAGMTGAAITPAVNNYSGFTAPATQTTVISGDGSTVVEYYYTRNSYMLTFTLGNDDPDLVSKVVYGADIAPPSIVWMGFEFDGWYIDEGFNNPFTFTTTPFTTMPDHDLTLYASWIPDSGIVYRAEYYQENLGGGFTLLEVEYPLVIDEGTVVKIYTGFTYDSLLSTTVTSVSSSGGTRITLKLFYSRNSYTLTFDANGGTGGTTETVLFGTALGAPDVRREGYTLTHWEPAIDPFMPANDITYTAQWKYTIEVGWITAVGNSSGDDGGTLVAALAACARDGGGTITLLVNFTMADGVEMPDQTTIDGNGYTITSEVNGSHLFRIEETSAVIKNLNIVGGNQTAVVNSSGHVLIENVIISQSGSSDVFVGGVYNSGTMIMKNSAIKESAGWLSGGFVNVSTMIMDGCSITENHAPAYIPENNGDSGDNGYYGESSAVDAVHSGGGGVNNGRLYLNNCTIANNRSVDGAGGINNYYFYNDAEIYVLNTTIAGNISSAFSSETGGISGGTIHFVNSIAANNFALFNDQFVSSDISEKGSAENEINIIFSYVGRFTDAEGADATPVQTRSFVNPSGYGVGDVFAEYQIVNPESVSIPVLTRLTNSTYAADQSDLSDAHYRGCITWFDYSSSGTVIVIAYDDGWGRKYLIGVTGGTQVIVYQGGSERNRCVMGAYCSYHHGC